MSEGDQLDAKATECLNCLERQKLVALGAIQPSTLIFGSQGRQCGLRSGSATVEPTHRHKRRFPLSGVRTRQNAATNSTNFLLTEFLVARLSG